MVSTGSTSDNDGSTNERTLLVANRGEIARRVIRTARDLGWRTVVLHTDLDAYAPHVEEADAAVRVESYLDVDEVVAAARDAGAGYVHPGYGFLSERAPFARALAEAGISLVGPSAQVMDAMGRKDAAREIAVAAEVPVVPAYSLDDDPETFAYPVLVKAAAGGGGKGMRVVRSAADFAAAADAARREAASSFGDDTLLVEKYVESGRHIEVQVIADAHGHVVHLFERDCSTQRRHQKVLEEAPAPTISAEQRQRVTEAAVALAAEVGYTNAGTVEFLLDDATGEAYFLEMNTRLQVEHPVTEEVVRIRGEGVDLVALQLAVAEGAELGFAQDDVTLEGHAIEARVYAEDSFGGFLPQAGLASYVAWPTDLPGVRVDHALRTGQEVSTAYDPMLGKVIAWGADREQARHRLVDALDATVVTGLTTNTGFLRTLLAGAEFRDATIDTAWLDRNEVPAPEPDTARVLAAAALDDTVASATDGGALLPGSARGPWQRDGWRMSADPAPALIELDRLVEVAASRGTVDGRSCRVLSSAREPGRPLRLEVELDGERHRGAVRRDGAVVEVVHQGQRFTFERPDAFADSAADVGDGTLTAPMPGTVLSVGAEDGQRVAEGDALVTMEAMKMELSLKAPFDGTVTAVDVVAGAQVKLGDRLVVVEPEEA
ncbi:ATP-grasp domain-containing protein [Nocardioides rotundus]|nr:ATP-grasp domain-containing protein [Nocardioides rotundus]